ncbi:Uncharacterised protein [BD1-7 clade bacterium]|uniref:Alginate export domain-containing protein n=1 Tax=BD1-7 clade bacterium TaxID=2029982 RepID=A0A5S9QTL9_9GAMM|nr:Uncharacterised protein [BD1-7 clade bacterium]
MHLKSWFKAVAGVSVFASTLAYADVPEATAEVGFQILITDSINDEVLSFQLKTAATAIQNNYFGNDEAVFDKHASSWYEAAILIGDTTLWRSSGAGNFAAAFEMLGLTTGGYDPTFTNIDSKNVNRFELNQLAIGWQSGDILSLGENALSISAGRQRFTIGNGFLIWKGGTDGGRHGTPWLGVHNTWSNTGLVNLAINDHIRLDAFYLTPNDQPNTDTQIYGINGDFLLPLDVSLGASFIEIFDSNTPERRHTRVYDLRWGYQQDEDFGLQMSAEWVFQEQPSRRQSGGASAGKKGGENREAWYAEAGWLFDGALPARLSYRYANFESGYDPLYPGSSGWGSWRQGEYLGQFVLRNENLQSHQAHFEVSPIDGWSLHTIYYYFLVNRKNEGQFSDSQIVMTDERLAQEIDLVSHADFGNGWTSNLVAMVVVPSEGGKQWSGGKQTVFGAVFDLQYAF